MKEFLERDIYFLRPDPDTTICDPANNDGIITCGYYNSAGRSSVAESGRGFTRANAVKPDFAAPGVDVYGPLFFSGRYPANGEERLDYARYGFRTGASMSAAVTAGVVALLAEWALIEGNDAAMDTNKAKKYLIRGADRSGLTIPSRIYGNGILNLFGVFENLRPRP